MFLYVHHNSDDFQVNFPCFNCRQRFVDLLYQLRNGFADLDGNDEPDEFQFEYEYDDQGKRHVLGKGTYGNVYGARDLITQVSIAVKEIPQNDSGMMPSLEESTSDSAGPNPDPALQQWLISRNLDSDVIAKVRLTSILKTVYNSEEKILLYINFIYLYALE
ncbi:mitogen-activated protein kinase kinase kinase 15-like [Artemia franciscana]|uniref:mitogen-activated protein kinase kinase kinase 15-like n=1 Tax=Artemia franciscana TaxID=6661 RepID=UPI0032DA5A32